MFEERRLLSPREANCRRSFDVYANVLNMHRRSWLPSFPFCTFERFTSGCVCAHTLESLWISFSLRKQTLLPLNWGHDITIGDLVIRVLNARVIRASMILLEQGGTLAGVVSHFLNSTPVFAQGSSVGYRLLLWQYTTVATRFTTYPVAVYQDIFWDTFYFFPDAFRCSLILLLLGNIPSEKKHFFFLFFLFFPFLSFRALAWSWMRRENVMFR